MGQEPLKGGDSCGDAVSQHATPSAAPCPPQGGDAAAADDPGGGLGTVPPPATTTALPDGGCHRKMKENMKLNLAKVRLQTEDWARLGLTGLARDRFLG
jgi:hypothetical protein